MATIDAGSAPGGIVGVKFGGMGKPIKCPGPLGRCGSYVVIVGTCCLFEVVCDWS